MMPTSPFQQTKEGTFRVLHVDDQPDFSELVSIYLEREDDRFVVESATSASEGLDRLSEQSFDCVISDFEMPGCNGIEFLEDVREEYPDLPFILFTGKGTEEVASDAISAGVTDYLQKQAGTDQYTLLANTVSNAVEHYRSLQMVRQRDQHLREVIERVTDAIVEVDSEWRFTLVNQQAEELYEMNEEYLLGRDFWEVFSEARATRFEEEYRQVMETREPTSFVEYFSQLDGWFDIEAYPMDNGGIAFYFVEVPEPLDQTLSSQAISAGVTEYIQKQSGTDQYALLANRIGTAVGQAEANRGIGLSHRAMDTATEGLSLVKPDGTFSYVNPAFARLFGYELPELIGDHWTVLYHKEEAERLENDILPAVGEHGYWSGETVRLTKDGERLVTDHRLAHTEDGVIVCTASDVTPERTATSQHGSGFDLLVDSIEGHAFYTLDHEGYITRWNKGAERLTGYNAKEIIGEHMAIFFTVADRDQGRPEEMIGTATVEGSVTDEGSRVRKDGSRFGAVNTLSASYDASGTIRGFGMMNRDASNESKAAQ